MLIMQLTRPKPFPPEPAKCADENEAKAYIAKLKKYQEIITCHAENGSGGGSKNPGGGGATPQPDSKKCPPKPVVTADDESWMKKLKMFPEARVKLMMQKPSGFGPSAKPAVAADDAAAEAYIKKLNDMKETLKCYEEGGGGGGTDKPAGGGSGCAPKDWTADDAKWMGKVKMFPKEKVMTMLQQGSPFPPAPAKCSSPEEAEAYFQKCQNWIKVKACHESGGDAGDGAPAKPGPPMPPPPPKPMPVKKPETKKKKLTGIEALVQRVEGMVESQNKISQGTHAGSRHVPSGAGELLGDFMDVEVIDKAPKEVKKPATDKPKEKKKEQYQVASITDRSFQLDLQVKGLEGSFKKLGIKSFKEFLDKVSEGDPVVVGKKR
jgi:hypothetical protein